MKLKIVTGIALFFLVFIGSDFFLVIFKDILGHNITSTSISSILVYRLTISTLFALSAVGASVTVSSVFISTPKTRLYIAALAAAIAFTTGWLLFRLFILRSYLQDFPSPMPASSSISIEIVNQIIINATMFILLLLLLAFGYMRFKHQRKVT